MPWPLRLVMAVVQIQRSKCTGVISQTRSLSANTSGTGHLLQKLLGVRFWLPVFLGAVERTAGAMEAIYALLSESRESRA